MDSQSFVPVQFTDLRDNVNDKSPPLGAIFLFLIFFLSTIFLYFLYLCTYRRQSPTANLTALPDRTRSSLGLDPATISGLPIVSYGSSMKKINSGQESECSICLGMFQEGERVKVMPLCHHGFHSECVDKWLRTRSSCPLCRASIHRLESES
ncbi:unnamed protein product [Ilex paraguariensis]|uniref:RING-type E3 ubiquitin transferase n=1 Tax=Ilex paraguariensis TaxID=185542 RepID=A0ABC8RFX2_9AQUA